MDHIPTTQMNAPLGTLQDEGTVPPAAPQGPYRCNLGTLSILTMRVVLGGATAIAVQAIATSVVSSAIPASLATSQFLTELNDTQVLIAGGIQDVENPADEPPQPPPGIVTTAYLLKHAATWYIIICHGRNVLAERAFRRIHGAWSSIPGFYTAEGLISLQEVHEMYMNSLAEVGMPAVLLPEACKFKPLRHSAITDRHSLSLHSRIAGAYLTGEQTPVWSFNVG